MRFARTTVGPMALVLLLALAGCGGGGGDGGGGGGGGGGTTTPTVMQGVFIDGPVDGLIYSAQPSGQAGVTANGGIYRFVAGDTVTFSLATGGTPIELAQRVHATGTVSTRTIVAALPNGLQIAAVLHALDTGVGRMNLGGLTIAPAIAQEIGNYISSGGTNLAGQASDDAFLRHLQATVTAPRVFAHTINGTSQQFLVETVIPNMQAALTDNPAPAFNGQVSRLAGTMTIEGSGSSTVGFGCTPVVVRSRAGGILNLTVQGDVSRTGVYDATAAAGSFHNIVTVDAITCDGITTPGRTTVNTIPAGSSPATVTVNGSAVTMNWVPALPTGCVASNGFTGTNVGAANPMITLTGQMSCRFSATSFTSTMRIQLVGTL